MNPKMTPAQHEEIKALLLSRRAALQAQMRQNQENLSPPSADEGAVLQRNVAREVDQALTNIDVADLTRIERALEKMADGTYGLCGECGCSISFERLKIEPQTQHCVACKSRLEKAHPGH